VIALNLVTSVLGMWLFVAPRAGDAPAPVPPPPPPPTIEHRPGQGVRVTSADGSFSLQTWLRGQIRDTIVHDPAVVPASGQTIEVKRASLFFAGNVFGPHNRYFTQFVFAPRDLGLDSGQLTQSPIFDVFFTFDRLRDLSVRVGQYKPAFSREFIAAWGDLQLVDRSNVQNEFHLDRDVGVDLLSDDLGGLDLFRYAVGVHSGQGRNSIARRPFRMSYVARLEVLPLGTFDEFVEADFERRVHPKLALGVAYAYQDRAPRDHGVIGQVPEDGGSTDIHEIVADGIFKVRGFSVLGEYFWRQGRRNPGSLADDMGVPLPVTPARNGMGWFAQAGYVLPRVPLELAARGGQTFAGRNSSLPSVGELGGGPGWYFQGHAFKVQADYFHTWSGVDITHGADQVRLQLQVAI
jgi:hypothetical protein